MPRRPPLKTPIFDPEPPPGEGEAAVLAWLSRNIPPDKDAVAQAAPPAPNTLKRLDNKKRGRNPAAWNCPLPDLEIDLHSHTVDEAIAKIADIMDAMEKAGFQCLRVVHGGGHPGYGPIKKALDRQFRSVWNHRVSYYRTEPDNAGSSLLVLKSSQSLRKK